MSKYSIISDVGNTLVKLLRTNLVPDIIRNTDAIGLCSPDEHGDLQVGIYLYDVRESEEVAGSRTGVSTEKTQRMPPQYINLYYAITAYSMSDLKFRAAEEQRILGRVIQVLGDNITMAGDGVGESAYPIRIEMQRMDNDEKMKLWSMSNTPYKLSLFYKIYPVEIESTRIKSVSRVLDIDFTVEEKPNE